ncbi:MAG: DNA-3-methyladenine glycosylase 2 family protein [Xanthomonadales bacterium]|nr:DNA-3-methyladenine glycosylase 2 family protein [Gammaproteobacteria bacterium]MBT8054920.1 DNA-3-methyladenine glycosylase 2 family protein [Gammaproteobacteria bacterium]NND57302.1 DNA-3-methyladenine glycosylase 2 family protein [Xanthomonadales bacterium]NNK51036.1 DNA-3-methyladenine glycosylase 2 family protein [Xanthomonadales bacterium]
MSRLRYNRRRAVEHLRGQCSSLGSFIDRCGPLKLRAARGNDLFSALSAAIVYQQLSGKAASTIHGRFSSLFDDDVPEAIQASRLSIDSLRGAGLSRNKALAIQDLAEKSLDGTLESMRRMARLDDGEIIENLCQVRGIGPWTAQMFLIFDLGRPDVMPATDLGVQKGIRAVYGISELPSPDQAFERTRHLAPYRSAASWYFWRAADTVLIT